MGSRRSSVLALVGITACAPPPLEFLGEADSGSSACSLAVTTSGSLPAPVTSTARLTGPALAATDSGFVIGFRDQDPVSGSLRAVIYYVTDLGVTGTPKELDLLGCVDKTPGDGLGAAYANGTGMMVTSLSSCSPDGAGAAFLPFDDQGSVFSAQGPQNPMSSDLTLGPVSALAPGSTPGDFEVVYRTVVSATPALERAIVRASGFKPGVPIVRPFGDVDTPYGLVATSPEIRAFLAPIGNETHVQVGPMLGDGPDTQDTFILPNAPPWAAMTAWDRRIAVAVPDGTGLTLAVAELSGNTATQIANGAIGDGLVAASSMSTLRTHLLVARGRAGGITLHRLENARDNLVVSPAESVELGVSDLQDFDGAHLAIATARNRVAIAWLTNGQLAGGSPTGGWALLDCNE